MILIYSLTQLHLLKNYIKSKNTLINKPLLDINSLSEIRRVTIQLPIYNELYVVEKLIDCISKLDYPKKYLEIQILDDSDDETLEIAEKKINELQAKGIDIIHIKRKTRINFKAGALKEGLKVSKGEFIAIFDSDFLPDKNWLLKVLPYFDDPEIGVVQTRWLHINKNYSLLTKVQSFALDAHFTLEQIGRNFKNYFINFNGTAGIWRKKCIIDAGNWEGDTLTEDLDLSYRAQLKLWKFKYTEHIHTRCQLPFKIGSIRSQQYRWNKGGAENFQKTISNIFNSSKIDLMTKVHSFFHLLNSTMFLFAFIVSFLSVPLLYVKNTWEVYDSFFKISGIFIISTLIFLFNYWILYKNSNGTGVFIFLKFLKDFLLFYTIAMGFSLNNSIAVIKGHLRVKSEFIRTPKFDFSKGDSDKNINKYVSSQKLTFIPLEGFMVVYFLFGIISSFTINPQGDYSLLAFHLILFVGYSFVFIKSVKN